MQFYIRKSIIKLIISYSKLNNQNYYILQLELLKYVDNCYNLLKTVERKLLIFFLNVKFISQSSEYNPTNIQLTHFVWITLDCQQFT